MRNAILDFTDSGRFRRSISKLMSITSAKTNANIQYRFFVINTVLKDEQETRSCIVGFVQLDFSTQFA